VLTVVDDHTRFCPAVRVCRQPTAMEVVAAPAGATAAYGTPKRIRCGNGAQFTAKAKEVDLWARARVEAWRTDHDEVGPHGAIGDRPPMALIRALEADLEGSPEPGALA
jgi:putative transposase